VRGYRRRVLILIPVLIPVAICKILIDHRDYERAIGARAPQDTKPATTRASATRPLTPPPSQRRPLSLEAKFDHSDQTLVPLFSRLPAELRNVIWKDCLDGFLDTFYTNGRMCGQSCVLPRNYESWRHDDCYTRFKLNSTMKRSDTSGMKGKLALILTCQRM
jgi:hypothetical protein